MTILKENVKSINNPCNMDYVDNSKTILKYHGGREHGGRRRRSGSM